MTAVTRGDPLPSGAEETPKPSLWKRWIVSPIVQQLTQGTSPHKIAQAVGFGLVIGIFPVIGANTLLSLLIGIPLRLNQPVLQAFKTVAIPLQWALILGYYRAGEWLFRVDPVSLSIPRMLEEFAEAPGPFFAKYGLTALYGVVVWLITSPIVIAVVYLVVRPIVETMARRLRPSSDS